MRPTTLNDLGEAASVIGGCIHQRGLTSFNGNDWSEIKRRIKNYRWLTLCWRVVIIPSPSFPIKSIANQFLLTSLLRDRITEAKSPSVGNIELPLGFYDLVVVHPDPSMSLPCHKKHVADSRLLHLELSTTITSISICHWQSPPSSPTLHLWSLQIFLWVGKPLLHHQCSFCELNLYFIADLPTNQWTSASSLVFLVIHYSSSKHWLLIICNPTIVWPPFGRGP